MAAAFRYLSPTNGFLPQSTSQAIAFVRDPKRFKLNKYVQMINCPTPVVYYWILDYDQPVRVPNQDYFRWPPGNYRPRGSNNTGAFQGVEVRTNRFDYPYQVDYQAIQASEAGNGPNFKAFFNAIILSQAMTNATWRFVSLMETAGTWTANQATNTADANTLNGGAGKWNEGSSDPASPHYLAIQKSILEAVKRIQLGTNGSMILSDLKLIVSPGLAMAMADTSEIHDYMAKQERSIKVLEGSEPDMVNSWGLPSRFCGLEVIVEDAVLVKEVPNTPSNVVTFATTNRTWIKSDTSAVICSRVGGIDGEYGTPNASTFQRYFYKYEMAVEAFDEPKHKLYESHVVDQFVEVCPAPRSGFLVTTTM